MRLTVGPLAPAVYWRRRAVVIAVLLVIAVAVTTLVNGAVRRPGGSRASGPGGAGGDPTATATVLTPVVGDSPSAGGTAGTDGGSAAPSGTASVPAASGPCTDAEIELTPSADPATPAKGQAVRFTLKIKNISNRSCTRDVGAGPQEIRIVRGTEVIWSSDYCQAGSASDVRTFGPGIVATFWVNWNGQSVGTGCKPLGTAAAGSYQLLARLDTKWSAPVPLTITGTPS